MRSVCISMRQNGLSGRHLWHLVSRQNQHKNRNVPSRINRFATVLVEIIQRRHAPASQNQPHRAMCAQPMTKAHRQRAARIDPNHGLTAAGTQPPQPVAKTGRGQLTAQGKMLNDRAPMATVQPMPTGHAAAVTGLVTAIAGHAPPRGHLSGRRRPSRQPPPNRQNRPKSRSHRRLPCGIWPACCRKAQSI